MVVPQERLGVPERYDQKGLGAVVGKVVLVADGVGLVCLHVGGEMEGHPLVGLELTLGEFAAEYQAELITGHVVRPFFRGGC